MARQRYTTVQNEKVRRDKYYVVVNGIIRETQKAVLADAIDEVWLPKSQIRVFEIDANVGSDFTVIELPAWLYYKKKFCFSHKTTPERLREWGYLERD